MYKKEKENKSLFPPFSQWHRTRHRFTLGSTRGKNNSTPPLSVGNRKSSLWHIHRAQTSQQRTSVQLHDRLTNTDPILTLAFVCTVVSDTVEEAVCHFSEFNSSYARSYKCVHRVEVNKGQVCRSVHKKEPSNSKDVDAQATSTDF